MLQLSENVEINRNSYRSNDVSARSENGLEENVEEYIKSHDATFTLPIAGTKVTLGARNLDNDEIDLKVSFTEGSEVQGSYILQNHKHNLINYIFQLVNPN